MIRLLSYTHHEIIDQFVVGSYFQQNNATLPLHDSYCCTEPSMVCVIPAAVYINVLASCCFRVLLALPDPVPPL